MADQTIRLSDARLQDRLSAAIDREAKIPRAVASLGPIEGRRVVILDADEGFRQRQLQELGAIVTGVTQADAGALPNASADVVVACWSMIRPGEEQAAGQVALAMRILDPAGRLLLVHDYGRDDVTALLGPAGREEQLMGWSHRHGPFLSNGFKLKVLHCWWSWDSLDDAVEMLEAAFGAPGAALGASMRRPRLSYKVAIYHRDHESAVIAPGAAA